MKFGWGGRIVLLYSGFVALIVTLVVSSVKQDIQLVSDDYYEQELEYQNVLNAGKNQSSLSNPARIFASESTVTIEFPHEFNEEIINGNVHFYSPINRDWDKKIAMNDVEKSFIVSREELVKTKYKIKLRWQAAGKEYYQESDINLF